MKQAFFIMLPVLLCADYTEAITGHVCTKQNMETYSTNYDRSFICPERYTTACGQLDWRRCTKYRVSTCYTPSQKYASRYVTVEVCCPGWRGDTCSEPICPGTCQNGGVCADLGDHPGCKCMDGFYGEACEHERNHTDSISVVLVCCSGVIALVVIVIAVILYKRRRPSSRSQVVPYVIPPDPQRVLGMLNSGYAESRSIQTESQHVPGLVNSRHTEHRPVPSAPHFS